MFLKFQYFFRKNVESVEFENYISFVTEMFDTNSVKMYFTFTQKKQEKGSNYKSVLIISGAIQNPSSQ